jgi:hypothetical protein
MRRRRADWRRRRGTDRAAAESRAFPQPFRASSDAAAIYTRDDAAMSSEALIIELADRRSDDLSVSLMWARRSGRLWVLVTNLGNGAVERIDARPDNALDVFNHPFAYAQAA